MGITYPAGKELGVGKDDNTGKFRCISLTGYCQDKSSRVTKEHHHILLSAVAG